MILNFENMTSREINYDLNMILSDKNEKNIISK